MALGRHTTVNSCFARSPGKRTAVRQLPSRRQAASSAPLAAKTFSTQRASFAFLCGSVEIWILGIGDTIARIITFGLVLIGGSMSEPRYRGLMSSYHSTWLDEITDCC